MKKIFYLFLLISISKLNFAAEVVKDDVKQQEISIETCIQKWNQDWVSRLDENNKLALCKRLFDIIKSDFLKDKKEIDFSNDVILVGALTYVEENIEPLVLNFASKSNECDPDLLTSKAFEFSLSFYKFIYDQLQDKYDLYSAKDLQEQFAKIKKQ